MSDKEFYYDFFTLKENVLEQWRRSYFWPVSRVESQSILLNLVDENTRMINELGNSFEGDCLTIYSQIWNPYIRMANYLLCLNRLQDAGYKIRYSDKSSMMRYLLEDGDFPVHKENLGALICHNETIRKMKNFQLSIQYNNYWGKHNIWSHFASSKSIYVTPDANVLHVPSTNREETWVRITTPEEWFSKWDKVRLESRMLDSIRCVAERYHKYALDYMRNDLGLKVPTKVANDLQDFHTKYLEHIAQIYQSIRLNVLKKCPSKLYVGTGKTYTKALSLAVREQGGIVRGHPHGYYVCHSASSRPHLHEFSTVDEFAVYTQPLKELFQRNISQFSPPRGNSVSFVSQKSDVFKRFYELYKYEPIPKKIKRVMILELQLWVDDVRYEVTETMISYHFYYKLCKTLTENGYEVIFKKRPKSWGWQDVNFFEGMPGVSVIYGSLEDPEIMNKADAIIFQYGLSSTFIPMMCSNKKLIYVDAGWEDWYPDVYDLIKKRCSILDCKHGEDNLQYFDNKKLLDILSEKPREPNMEFFEKYLEPE